MPTARRSIWTPCGRPRFERASRQALAGALPDELRIGLRDRLVAMAADEAVDQLARIEAGLSLGELGDPRFEARTGPDSPDRQPPMDVVAAGEYIVGHEGSDPRLAFSPRHVVRLASFDIGRFPVTNGEWALFAAVGGYDDERWWDTRDAKAWRRGDLTAEGSRSWVRDWLDRMRADQASSTSTPVRACAPSRSRCGGDGRPYPWGTDSLVSACNTLESHLRRATPVGVPAQGRAPCGAEMVAGDVGEWTASLRGPDAERCTFGYPYRPDDGREDAESPAAVRRVQRGGCFFDAAL